MTRGAEALAVLVLASPLVVTASASAQWVDANGEAPKAVARAPQRSAYGGEKEDLRLSVEDVRWIKKPCDDHPKCTVIRGVQFSIWVEWLNYPGPWLFGTTDLDSREPAEDQDGPDALIVHWEPGWVYASASGDPSRVGSTSVAWTNETNCPESPRLTGRHHVAERTDGTGKGRFGTFGFHREIELDLLNPQAESCRVPSLQLRVEYLHTYDDDLHVSWGGSVAIGISVDIKGNPSVSVGTTVNFTNNHAWNTDATFKYDPPREAVRRCPCCPEPQIQPRPEPKSDEGEESRETPSDRGASVPTPSGGRLVLPPSVSADGAAFGTAIGPDGAILTGVVVEVGDEQTMTDDEGRVWIAGDLPAGDRVDVQPVSAPEGPDSGEPTPSAPARGSVPVIPAPEIQGSPPRLDRVPEYAGWQDFIVHGSGLGCAPGQDIGAFFGETEARVLACDGQSTWIVQPTATDGTDLPVGPVDFYVAVDGKASNAVPVQTIRLHSRLDPPTLRVGRLGWAVYEIEGTHEPVRLRVTNHTPSVIRLVGGSPQEVTTSGGETNQVRVRFRSLAPGSFHIQVEYPD